MSTLPDKPAMGLQQFTDRVKAAGWTVAVRELQPHLPPSSNYTAERERILPTLTASQLLLELDRVSAPLGDDA